VRKNVDATNYKESDLEDLLEILQSQKDTFISVLIEESSYSFLFDTEYVLQARTKIICRIVKKIGLEEDSQDVADRITKCFELISGLDGSTKWYERKEGTSSFVRLLREIPRYERGLVLDTRK
jgi:hypothetical protein